MTIEQKIDKLVEIVRWILAGPVRHRHEALQLLAAFDRDEEAESTAKKDIFAVVADGEKDERSEGLATEIGDIAHKAAMSPWTINFPYPSKIAIARYVLKREQAAVKAARDGATGAAEWNTKGLLDRVIAHHSAEIAALKAEHEKALEAAGSVVLCVGCNKPGHIGTWRCPHCENKHLADRTAEVAKARREAMIEACKAVCAKCRESSRSTESLNWTCDDVHDGANPCSGIRRLIAADAEKEKASPFHHAGPKI